jgi:hypothetical protein
VVDDDPRNRIQVWEVVQLLEGFQQHHQAELGSVYGVWAEHVEAPATAGRAEVEGRKNDNNTVVNVGTAAFH